MALVTATADPFIRSLFWTLQVLDGFVRDDTAEACERVQDWLFLRTGIAPRAGQRLFVYVSSGPQLPLAVTRRLG